MTRIWLIGPLAAVLALGAGAYWWQVRKDDWQPPAALAPELPQLVQLPASPPVRAAEAQARPLLWSSRRPMDNAGEPRKNGQQQELAQSRLLAVLQSGGERVALLQRADGTALKITGRGEPWRIESFDGRQAVFLSASGQRIELALELGPSPQATAPAPPAPRSIPRQTIR